MTISLDIFCFEFIIKKKKKKKKTSDVNSLAFILTRLISYQNRRNKARYRSHAIALCKHVHMLL